MVLAHLSKLQSEVDNTADTRQVKMKLKITFQNNQTVTPTLLACDIIVLGT